MKCRITFSGAKPSRPVNTYKDVCFKLALSTVSSSESTAYTLSSAMISPSANTMARSVFSMAKCMSWVMNKMVLPYSLFRILMKSIISV
jgi:hypothetical protein